MKYLLALTFFFLVLGCKEKVHCMDAKAFVVNVGDRAIPYCWGCNSYGDTLYPGDSAFRNVGEIEITATTERTTMIHFDTPNKSYVF